MVFPPILFFAVSDMKEMKDIFDYIEKYGDKSFEEKEFNEIDNIIFSQLVYNDFGTTVGKDEVFLCDAAMDFFAKNSDEELEELIGITQKSAALLMECAKTRRYGYVRLCDYVNSVNCEIDKQFAGMNFILNDKTLLVAFRGTDTTIAGIKESAMLSYMFPVPAQIEALHYFQETAMVKKCEEIILCGHSKGGNLALYAAVNCSNSLKKKIAAVYEDDAPGFPKCFFERYDFKQIAPKTHFFTPQGSIIGRMLNHANAPIIVESTNSGLKQHQVSSWVIENDKFKTCEKYDASSDFFAEYINKMIDYVGEDDLEQFFNAIDYVLTNIGIDDFYDFKSLDLKKIYNAIDTLSDLTKEQKEHFKLIIKKASTDFAMEYFGTKARSYIDKIKPELPTPKRAKIEKQTDKK